jgi:DNA-binding transcriptional LysR family regulator
MKHLRILEYVDAVARARSIRKAAEQLNVTASAVNRRIADLEEELDAQLFERLPRLPLFAQARRRSRAHEIADRGS